MSSELGDSGLRAGTEFHCGHQRGQGRQRRVRRHQKESGVTTEGAPTVYQALGHTLPKIISFDPYNDLGREEPLIPHFTEQETKAQSSEVTYPEAHADKPKS